MDSEYDQKFEEMKKYIPFLESMIKRLESTGSSSKNPRQAQLDKIRSLRDLLLNKKKRMKMENLLKCEQVLVNLYAKVEQRETISVAKNAPDPGFSIDPPTPQEKSNLEAVRNKLKTVVKRQEEIQDTLPEILRGNEFEEVQTAGSKEPALFQRRPNKNSLSPTKHSPSKTADDRVSPQSSTTKRNYTRVLVSPEANTRRWTTSETAEDKPLFSRRSPRKSPRRYSPSFHKRERKKSSKETSSRKGKDLNITLNVPEDSLSTLNTKDIFTRIINCRDGDVDIDTLRGLRKQILSELQKTGANEDISDLILKSYKQKNKSKKRDEVEEGELSDSESEAIENIYGNLVLKDQNETKNLSDKDKARKIQICLVINSDKDNTDSNVTKNTEPPKPCDFSELEMYDKESKANINTNSNKEVIQPELTNIAEGDNKITEVTSNTTDLTNAKEVANENLSKLPENETAAASVEPNESIPFKANFYKPLTENSDAVKSNKLEESTGTEDIKKEAVSITENCDSKPSTPRNNVCNIEAELEKMEKNIEIPLLNEPTIPATPTDSVVSEIDILQALKNDILNETISISGLEASTPLLHQPKLITTKVASAQEILPKKRISIEKYKEKAVNSVKLFLDEHLSSKDDHIKKTSLKLTEKECERFNIPKISFDDDSSDEGDGGIIEVSDIYSDLAPKSPDDSSNIESIPPVIIPVDPVKMVSVNYKADIDMRTLPMLSPKNINATTLVTNNPMLSTNEMSMDIKKSDSKIDQTKGQSRFSLSDPRVRRESNQSPSSHIVNADRTPRPVFTNIAQSPATNVVMTPNTRSYNMTPSHQSFDIDQSSNKHVYVPTFSAFDPRERENSVAKESRWEKIESPAERRSRFDDIGDASWSSSDTSQNTRFRDSFTSDKFNKGHRNDRYRIDNRVPVNKPMTPLHPFGRGDCPSTPSHSFGRSECPPTPSHSFGRSECPLTPSHSFGRSECPPTPSHPFGGSECPPTPGPSFGRLECPPTPSHSFGRSECPPTPNHSFGRLDCSSTPNLFGSHTINMSECPSTPTPSFGTTMPNHPFGVSDCPQTLNHPFGSSDTTTNLFGRSELNTQKYTKDPRLNRKSDHETNSQFDERDRGYYKDRGYYRSSSYKSHSGSDSYKNQDREHGRNSKYRYYAPDKSGRQFKKDQPRRDQSVGGSSLDRHDRERERLNSEPRGYEEVGSRRRNHLEKNVISEKNITQYVRPENSLIRSSTPSVDRNSSIESESKTLSVKSHAGRSFTIDTSINATFQDFLKSGKGLQVFEYNFDARRQRAASVGRSLVRESSVGRVLSDSKPKTRYDDKRDHFRRASSMGREIVNSTVEQRTFKEIKEDFETYRFPVKESCKFDIGKIRNIDTKSKNSTEHIGRSRKDIYEKQKDEKYAHSTKSPYSPRKNYRDPRMRKECDTKNKYDKYGNDPRARKSGIVYSNDNIVRGAILTSGYGVKNYKIPKIKRVTEEKEVESLKNVETITRKHEKQKDKNNKGTEEQTVIEKSNDKSKDKIKENPKQKVKEMTKEKIKETPKGRNKEIIKDAEAISDSDSETDKLNKQIDEIINSGEQIERRLTRSCRRILSESKTEIDQVTKPKKTKKPTIIDSDSDSMSESDERKDINEKISSDDDTKSKKCKPISPLKEKRATQKPSTVDINASFGLEELEMFSDNIVSDPVIDNINALIADLDNDLDTSKNESSNNFTKEILLENMMQNISSPQEHNFTQSGRELSKVPQDVPKISDHENSDNASNLSSVPSRISPEIFQATDDHNTRLSEERDAVDNIVMDTNVDDSQGSNNTEDSTTEKRTASQLFDQLLCSKETPENNSIQIDAMDHSQETLSSNNLSSLSKPPSENIVSTTETEKDTILVEGSLKTDEKNIDGSSTPDSTINTDDILEKTNNDECLADSTNEVHSETNVTSTDCVDPKPSSLHTDAAPGLESIGSLLSILQDKSKMKELLTMLGDKSGDNEKIKKKLEKLSEIVSDDENDETTEHVEQTHYKKSVSMDGDMNETVDVNAETNEKEAKQFDNNCVDVEKDVSPNDITGKENEEKKEIDLQVIESKYKKRVPVKKSKFSKKSKGKNAKKVTSMAEKRVTRATAAVETKTKQKKPPRELQKLHEDIKEMFIKEDILSATGIRMCRLAKLVDEKTTQKEEVSPPEAGPVVVIEKFKTTPDKIRDMQISEKNKKKPGPKSGPKTKTKISTDSIPEIEKEEKKFKPAELGKEERVIKYKPGPKSKTKNKRESDPYAFEIESVGDTITEKASGDDSDNSTDSEMCSLASSHSFGSSELLADIKKKTKRKRRGWQDGVIKPKNKKKKVESKPESTLETRDVELPVDNQTILPDMNCFTDKQYCFRKNELNYSCRFCLFTGTDIVHHYKNDHPHVEIPLSRMAPQVAKEAIDQCKEINFQAVSRISSDKYICIFCFKEFSYNSSVLETFFWHVVSMHTGEYKHNCSECVNESQCPFSLDIPPPPKDLKGQLIGFICKKCNFTQLSLENLKTHVIVRHNDEQTAVYTINLAAMSKKALKEFLQRCDVPELPVVQASIHPQEIAVKTPSEERSNTPESSAHVSESKVVHHKSATGASLAKTFQSKITFEADDNVSELSDLTTEGRSKSTIKIEQVDAENPDEISHDEVQSSDVSEIDRTSDLADHSPSVPPCQEKQQFSPISRVEDLARQVSNDIVDYPHFKINITDSGVKEYICCINRNDHHFKTALLISMKKHVQLKHSENWDGYCFVCKVIVTPQGRHHFKDCFQHYLDKHMDTFPIFEKEVMAESAPKEVPDKQIISTETPSLPKTYINVRPLAQLVSTAAEVTTEEDQSFPIIQSVVSLGTPSVEASRPSPIYPTMTHGKEPLEVIFKYEEVQAQVMLNKHRVVLETMMARNKLVKVYKCAGRFCSFTTDSAEEALLHASTHQRVGGVDALNCSYCDFDAMGNAIDLVMHVFKAHGHCQFSCEQCFYRAAASQSVGAHMSRVHGIQSGNVLRTTTITGNTAADANMLTREQAVPYYVCNHGERDSPCKFRTYTHDKFCDHLKQKHATATSHSCYMCQTEATSAAELVQHMKSHGLKLYQCTWCVFGGDNEGDLLAHVSAVHPTKQPQAYVRIITNKDGSNVLRVLPLAYLNKQKVPTEDVTPSTVREDPVREAERSIDLQKLIELTVNMEPIAEPIIEPVVQPIIPPIVQPTVHSVVEPITRSNNDPVTQTSNELISEPHEPAPGATFDRFEDLISNPVIQSFVAAIDSSTRLESAAAVVPVLPSDVTVIAPKQTDIINNQSDLLSANPPQDITPTVPVKIEPKVINTTSLARSDEVVVLDSDDEESNQLDIPSTSGNKNNKVVPGSILGTCPKCRQVCKTMNGLKKHMHYCYPNVHESSTCAHCSYVSKNRDDILNHYIEKHCDRNLNVYQCGVCRVNLMSLAVVKKHLRYVHKEKEFKVMSTMRNGIGVYTVDPLPSKEKKELPKRKLSATIEPLEKPRFGPGEIDQLPINPILDHLVYCDICEFSTKVRLNMVRHLQLHAEQQPVAQTAPVNPVPYLETNEKHFDKMVNLASSSAVKRTPEKPRTDIRSFVPVVMPREIALRYPRQVSPRRRNTCGSTDCTYTSVDEGMLKQHWDTLHSKIKYFRCVHCPPSQTLDDKKPLNGSRVIAHLKMHDENLYACSKCNFYHYKRDFVEKHLTELHPTGQLMIVREGPRAAAAAAPSQSIAAPTMDLKPWQCGLCEFKTMLRPEVADHCFQLHQSKMQFRCGHCPYRASALENVHKHLAHSHADQLCEVIYYYYREGSLPDEGGTPRWMKQRQMLGAAASEIKTETTVSPVPSPPARSSPVNLDLNLVKKEVVEEPVERPGNTDHLFKRFGQLCGPNGIKFKCPLCSAVTEDTREAMQSHLYEELNYRKWGCGVCTYKAFHKGGLTDHMLSEHRRQYDYIELPKDNNIETWVTCQLDHQAGIIDKYRTDLAKQKVTIEKIVPKPSTSAQPKIDSVSKYSDNELKEAFGFFGNPSNRMFCCPKCGTMHKDETTMKDHLEMELNKIRWGCTNCSDKFQTYHEAQFHCKGHDGPSRPVEAVRDPLMRQAWISNTIQAQSNAIRSIPVTPNTSEPPTPEKSVPDNDNSLLVVRYAERVPTPDQVSVSRKRPAQDSDDERLVIVEPAVKKKNLRSCPHCEFLTKSQGVWREHVLNHFNLKPYTCWHCEFSSDKQGVLFHIEQYHPNQPLRLKATNMPTVGTTTTKKLLEDDTSKVICLFCEKAVPESEAVSHLHENIRPDFAKKGDVVIKCCICLVLRLDMKSFRDHHNLAHPCMQENHALFKMHHDTRETHNCSYCHKGFKFLRDLKSHHNAVHSGFQLKYTTAPYMFQTSVAESKKKDELPQSLNKRCARKSTTKLPRFNSIAKKSTTRLPYSVPSTSDDGYSYYKTTPEPLEKYANVTTMMSFWNRMMPFTLKKLSEIINIEPKVVVKDVNNAGPSDMT